MTIGLGARGESGVPLSFLGDHPIYLSPGEVPIGGRGAAGRTPSNTQLDLHLDYPVPLGSHFGEKYSLKLAMGTFNVTNSQFETGRVQETQLRAFVSEKNLSLNEHFGSPKDEDGWRTDQGRIYITLGEPQVRTTYPNARNVRPLIVWFYQTPSPALPPFFYIVFYKRSAGDPYTLYAPYQDGPNRLLTGLEGMNEQKKNLKALRDSLGDEVARLAISLIPTEPVNLNDYSPTMVSDSMLATIRGLPDNYLEKRSVANNRQRERVTASILSSDDQPTVAYMVSRNERGESVVNYLIQFPSPDPNLIGARKDKTLGYDLTLQTHVFTKTGKPVYDDVDVLSGHLQPGQAEVGKKKAFAAEERLPLAPGEYLIESVLTNNLNLQAHRFSEKVVVPERKAAALGMSDLVVFSGSPSRDEGNQLPFSFSDLRFNPRAIRTVMIHPRDRLPCVFQLWVPQPGVGAAAVAPVQMHYAFVGASMTGRPLDESDETVATNNMDAAGNLITGHTFETGALVPGNYRLIVRATEEGTTPVSASLNVQVVSSDVPTGVWSVYGPPEPAQDATKRALSARAQASVSKP